jgi:hypothetical protein
LSRQFTRLINASGAGKLFFDFFSKFFERAFNHEWTGILTTDCADDVSTAMLRPTKDANNCEKSDVKPPHSESPSRKISNSVNGQVAVRD